MCSPHPPTPQGMKAAAGAAAASGPQLAAGRLVGSLAVVTAKDEDATAAMLASWIAQVGEGGLLLVRAQGRVGAGRGWRGWGGAASVLP